MSKKSLKKRVEDQFDPVALKSCCEEPSSYFAKYADRQDLPGKDRFLYFRDNGSDILAVAHLDYVHHNADCNVMDTSAGKLVLSGALDDRLGAYIVCELLPRLGVNVDILLTTDEETCGSTADDFETEKQYNWIIEFDRGGTDVVMYQFETGDYAALVKQSGSYVGNGSYSDIAVLDFLGVAAFNWGVGYQDY